MAFDANKNQLIGNEMNIEPPSGRQTFAHQRSMADRLNFQCVLVLCIACSVAIKWPFVSINANTMYRKRTAIRYLCSLFAHSFNRYLNYVLITRRSKLNTQFTNITFHIYVYCLVARSLMESRNENSENGRTNAKSRQRHLCTEFQIRCSLDFIGMHRNCKYVPIFVR